MNLARNKYPVSLVSDVRSCGNRPVQIVCFALLPEKMHVIPARPYFYGRILFSLNFPASVGVKACPFQWRFKAKMENLSANLQSNKYPLPLDFSSGGTSERHHKCRRMRSDRNKSSCAYIYLSNGLFSNNLTFALFHR